MQVKQETIIGAAILALFVFSAALHFIKPAEPSSHDAGVATKASQAFFKEDGIAVIHVSGPIYFSQNSSNSFFLDSADLILDQLKKVEYAEHVKGLLLKVNSPGGTVGASQEILAALRRIKAQRNIPIVAQIGDVGASGAYYVSLGADKIYANPGSIVGSIGVIMSGLNIEEFASKHGVKNKTYKSGPYKDVFSMWREPSATEDAMIQTMINTVHGQFVSDVVQSRNLSPVKANKLAQGQIFTGSQALTKGLIDELGGYHDALRYLGELTGLGDNPVVIQLTKSSWKDFANVWTNQFKQSLFMNQQLLLQ